MYNNVSNEIKNLLLNIKNNINDVSEEDLRQAINMDLINRVRKKYNINIIFKNEKYTGLKEDISSYGGYIDTKYGDIIFEYKRPTHQLNDKDREQLFGYLENKKNKVNKYGILTNGINLEIYEYNFENNRFELNNMYSGKFNEFQLIYISELLGNREKLIVSENNINELFGIYTNKKLIKRMFNILLNSKKEKTKLLFKEWQRLFNLSESYDKYDEEKKKNIYLYYEELLEYKITDTRKEYQALFAIQTYYALIIKLLIYKIIIELKQETIKKNKHIIDFFKDLENNKLFRTHGIINLIDEDFFSWYLDEFEDKDFEIYFSMIKNITSIKTNKTNFLFIKFYENIFPSHVRHSMGEYYTPSYLAKSVIEKTMEYAKNKNSFLDPTCGSGVFILNAMSLGIEKVYGIDINPLAVLTSKINYLINIDLDKYSINNKLEIPIYLGDSTNTPYLVNINGIMCYEYKLPISSDKGNYIEFRLSKDFVESDILFEVLDSLESQIIFKNRELAINILKINLECHYDYLKKEYNSLIDKLIELEEQKLNSIWLKLIGNFLKASSIKNIDIISGNPPWVKWGNLPDKYREEIKSKLKIDGLFSKDTNVGGVDLNICVLIAHLAIRDRLNKDGALGFLMPDSVLFNKSFEGFRNYELPDGLFYLNEVIRWNNNEKPFDPVSLNFSEFYFSFLKNNKLKIYDKKTKKVLYGEKCNNSFNNHYIIGDQIELDKILKVLGTNNLKFRSGVSLVKGGGYLLKYKEKVNNKVSRYYIHEKINDKIKLSNKTIDIENDIVYPYIKSNQINDNEINKTNYYAIFPYEYGCKEPMSLEKIKNNYPLFYNYFMTDNIQKQINSSSNYNKRIQKTKLDLGIFRVGEYTFSDRFLITRDNTKSVFSMIEKIKMPWGEYKIPIFDGHINYLTYNEKGEKLKREELEYLFKIFTQEGVKKYIKNSSDTRSISARLYNDIKLY